MNEIAHTAEAYEVFYDGECPLCDREIAMVRWMDRKSNRLKLIDIAEPDFSPEDFGKTLDELHREIHGKTESGTWDTGVDVFREIYSRVGFRAVIGPSRWFGIRHLLSAGYHVFAKLRYRSAMKRLMKKCDTSCSPLNQPSEVK